MPLFRHKRTEDLHEKKSGQLEAVSTSKPVLMITVFELEEDLILDAIQRILDRHGKRFSLVFVTSSASFFPFLRHEVPFEFLMGLHETQAHSNVLNWHAYTQEKWELLLVKWMPEKVVSIGISPERFLNLQPTDAL